MPQALPVHHFTHPIPHLAPALKFAVEGAVVLMLAIALLAFVPTGTKISGWDAGSYLAALDH